MNYNIRLSEKEELVDNIYDLTTFMRSNNNIVKSEIKIELDRACLMTLIINNSSDIIAIQYKDIDLHIMMVGNNETEDKQQIKERLALLDNLIEKQDEKNRLKRLVQEILEELR